MEEDLTVLVVEDNPAEVDLIQEGLPEAGHVQFKIESAARLSQALARLSGGGIDAVLLDLGLPDSQGLDTLRAVAGAAPHVPTVVLTGQDDEKTGQAAVREGAQDYLVKGTTPRQMLWRVLRFAVERHRAKENLRQSEEKYRALFEHMAQGVFYKGADGVTVDANPAVLKMFGLNREEILGRISSDPAWDIVREDGSPLPCAERPSTVALRTGKPVKDVVAGVFNPQTKSYAWLLIDAIPQFRRGETVCSGVFVTLYDITTRKQAEEALKQAERKYRSIFDNAVEGIYQSTPEGEYLSVNPALARMCGFENPDEMAASIADIKTQLYVDPEDRTRIEALYETVGVVKNFETRFRRTDGRMIWVSINGRAVRDECGKTLCYEGTIEDITERKQAEEAQDLAEAQLRQAQKMEALGTLAGGIAHDFNNILGIISGYTEIAQWEAGEGSPLNPNLNEVLKAVHRAKDLVQQILAFARRGEQERKPVPIGLIVKEAMKMLRASLPSSIEIKLNVRSKAAVMGDPTQIHQVLMNLCTNAGHAMRDKGGVLEASLTDVRIETEYCFLHSRLEPGPYVKLTVEDTGHGMDPAILDRIFDPFFTTKEHGVGTGLGLAVVHGIVKSHGGAIEVESVPGKGTKFHVFFPALEAGPVLETAAPAPAHRGCERILIVDDEPALTEAMKQTLGRLGYEVDGRTNSTEALETFRLRLTERPFDLVITDMTMPHLTGVDLARELLRLQPNLPIVLCTGFSEKMDAEKTRSLGIRRFLMKPVIFGELAELVRKVLDERST